MLLYLIVVLLPLLACYGYQTLPSQQKNTVERNKLLLWTLFLSFLLVAIRGNEMGPDTLGYWESFSRFSAMSWIDAFEDTRMEMGFVVFTKLIGYVTSSPEVFQVICTTIYFICFYQFAKSFEGDVPFYFLFFFISLGEYFFFTGIRQCLAISLVLLSYRFVIERKLVWFLAIIALAYTIHHSVLLFLVAYPMANMKVNFFNMACYLVVLLAATTYLEAAQSFLNEQLEYNYEIEKTDNGGIFLVLISILTYFSYVTLYKGVKKNKFMGLLFNLNIVTLFFWVLRLQTRVAERPSFYFLPFSCMLFAYMVKNTRDQLIKWGLILVPLVYYLYRLTSTFKMYLPYKSFFSNLL